MNNLIPTTQSAVELLDLVLDACVESAVAELDERSASGAVDMVDSSSVDRLFPVQMAVLRSVLHTAATDAAVLLADAIMEVAEAGA